MTARTSAFRRIIYTDPDLRVSDAERNEVADALARHYSDGRLTQDEFDERVSRAMSAKTRSDLDGLFADLPGFGEPEVPARRPARRRHHHRGLLLVLLVVLAAVAWHGLWWFFVPQWLILLVIAAVVISVIRSTERRHRD